MSAPAIPKAAFPHPNGFDSGMTLRDYFAAAAMQGYVGFNYPDNDTARRAYDVADAMMKERES